VNELKELNKKFQVNFPNLEPHTSKLFSMKLEQVDLGETGCFSSLFLDYINQKPELKSFYNLYPTPHSFKESIASRSFSKEKREILHKELLSQYSNSCSSLKVKDNIDLLLDEKTFTITTGHQLNIFTGPLYFIYKIQAVIHICNILKKEYPDYNFVPVYWMASEDHDFEEINHFFLYGKKYEWKVEAKGGVGRLSPKDMIQSLEDIAFIPEKFTEPYKKQSTLADATRELVNELFGKYGLVVIDPDRKSLKSLFKGVITKEITERRSLELVEKTTGQLSELGYKSQIHPREINLFYLEDGLRERIEWDGNKFRIINTDLSFEKNELLKVIEESPEKFSPNVVLRPVYQEEILPNLAYIGGPAEVAYWLQLKEVFNLYHVPFPILMPRSFALFVNKSNLKKFNKLNIQIKDLFLEESHLKTKYLEANSDNNFHLNGEAGDLEMIFNTIKEKAVSIDKSLKDYVGAEFHKVRSVVESIEKKLKKAEEKNQEIAINQLLGLKAKLFPNGQLQERHDNFLNFYLNDQEFIDKTSAYLDSFDFKFNVLLEDEES